MAGRLLSALFVAVFIPLSLCAKAPQFGSYFGLQSPSGAYLSALPGERLILVTHLSGWEQWQIGGAPTRPLILSFHGTVLAVVTGARVAIHCGDLYPTSAGGVNNEVLNLWMESPANGAADEVMLVYRANTTPLYLSEESGGTLSFITGQLPRTKWKVVPVAPQPGRHPNVLGIHDVEYVNLRSAHGTFLMEAGENRSKQWTFKVEHRPAPMPSPYTDLIRVSTRASADTPSNPVAALHFGQTVYLTVSHQVPYGLRPSPVKNPSGHTTVEMASTAIAGWTGMELFFKWEFIDPTGVYKTGERIPMGIPLVLRNQGLSANLSADPAFPTPQLTQSTGAWEHWVVMQR